MTKKWFTVRFEALMEVEVPDDGIDEITLAMRDGEGNAECIEEYIGGGASGDPRIYGTKCVGVVPHEGKLPWDEEEERRELQARAYRVGAPVGIPAEIVGTTTHCEHGVPYADWRSCEGCRGVIRGALDKKGPTT